MILNCRYPIIVSDISLKLDVLGYIFVAESLGIYSTTSMQCARKLPNWVKTQNEGQFAVQDHLSHRIWYQSKTHINFLLVINIDLPPILHRFRDIAFDRSKNAIFGTPLVVNPSPD